MQLLINKMKKKSLFFLASKKFQFLLRLAFMTSLLFFWRFAFAEDDTDPLKGMLGGLVSTMSSGGGGRTAAFIVEGIVAVATYIKTKNLLLMFGGIVAIEIFLRILMKLVGG